MAKAFRNSEGSSMNARNPLVAKNSEETLLCYGLSTKFSRLIGGQGKVFMCTLSLCVSTNVSEPKPLSSSEGILKMRP